MMCSDSLKIFFSYRQFAIVLSMLLAISSNACSTTEGSLKNPDLKTIRPDYPGNTMCDGQFVEPYMSDIANTPWPLIRWGFTRNPKKQIKKQEQYALDVHSLTQWPSPERDYLLWLGHASFLLHLNGKTLLTDPCLTAPPTMKRKAAIPLEIGSIVADYLLISHGHYDHLDQRTLAQLQGNTLKALVPLKIGPLVHGANPAIHIQEAGWYQQFKTDNITITLLPAKHWNRRTMFDFNQTLWGSFLIQTKTRTFYFAGDTGYAGHFKEIAALVGPIDYAILPIGAYDPSFIMQPSHLNPEEALQAFQDLGAKYLIPMHYGTFDLSDEPLGEPIKRLKQLIHERQLESSTVIPEVGTPLFLD